MKLIFYYLNIIWLKILLTYQSPPLCTEEKKKDTNVFMLPTKRNSIVGRDTSLIISCAEHLC